ncbi:MAG: biopolymer transporter ExbD [Planctomycetota bacterium]|nr:MAG: biopolymer transporter ExbD [Planctomycetota bacterium]
MPIQFRCSHCRQRLSVTRRKAGQQVSCPTCEETVRVPTLEEAQAVLAAKESATEKPPAAVEPEAAEDESPAAESPPPTEAAPPEIGPAPTRSQAVSAPQIPDISGAGAAASDDVAELWRSELREIDPWQADEDELEGEDFQIGKRGLAAAEMDMTPMVDVTFLLLIFFMITAAFDLQKSLQTTPPEPEEEGAAQTVTLQEIQDNSIEVVITTDDAILVDDNPVPGPGVLVDVLTKAATLESPPRTDMLIRADYRATHGMVVAVTDAGMEANMQHIRRVTERSEEE